jgi:hypothetical protein
MPEHFGPISDKAKKIRNEICHQSMFLIDNAVRIHYSQERPIDYDYRQLPWSADCSGSTAAVYKASGAKDPTGEDYNGFGNTDTILATLRPIDRIDARRGDLVLFHVGSDGRHVAILLESPRWHPDPWLESHGGEYGPLHVPLSTEIRYHSGETFTFLKGVDDWI